VTVLAAVLIATLVALTLGGAWLGAAVVARHRAQAAADLAALAAAARLPGGAAAACRQAQVLAEAMRATLRGCDVERLDVTVTVSARVGGRIAAKAAALARAGPTDDGRQGGA
jgi:secretion/DNA translocation related TadE-like protein